MLILIPTAMMIAQATMVATVAASFAVPAMMLGTAQAIAAQR